MMETFGISSDEAYTLIAQGAQKGLNKNDDLLDTINEYSSSFKRLGLNSEEMFNALVNGAKSGTFSVDKLGDAVKEFEIRAKDGSDVTNDAFKALGLEADATGRSFAEGGKAGKKAFSAVTKALFEMEDPMEQNTVGVALFGTMWEDLGPTGVKALVDIQGEANKTAGTLDEINEIKYDDFGSAITGIGRRFETSVLAPIGEKILPILNDFAGVLKENMPIIEDYATGIGDIFAALAAGLMGADAPAQLEGWERGFFNLGETANEVGAIIFEVIDGIKTNLDSNAPAIDAAVKTLNESMQRLGDTGGEESELGQMLGMIDEIIIGAQKAATLLNNLSVVASVSGKLVGTALSLMNPFEIDQAGEKTEKLKEYGDELTEAYDNLWRDLQEDAYEAGAGNQQMLASGMEANRQYVSTAANNTAIIAAGPVKKLPGEMQAAGASGAMNLGDGINAGTPWALIDAKHLHDSVKDASDPLVEELGGIGSGAATSMGAGIDVSAPIAGLAAVGIYDIVTGALNSLPTDLKATAVDMINKIRDGIVETASNVYGAVTGLVNDILTKFKEGLGIASPAKELFEIGKYMIQGLINGLNGDSLMAFVNSMIQDLKDKFAAGSFNLKAAIDFIGTGAAEFFKSIGIGGADFKGLTVPVDGAITSGFGYRDSFMTDSGEMSSSDHPGIDIGAAYGAAVGAAGAGTVTQAGWNGGYGNSVTIDHGNGLETLYAHLSEILVSVGDLVTQMQTIGLVGSTGNSTGAHLHFGVYQDGVAVDPSSLFGLATGTNRVPRTAPYLLHKDEAVIPKKYNPYLNNGPGFFAGVAEKMQAAVAEESYKWTTSNSAKSNLKAAVESVSVIGGSNADNNSGEILDALNRLITVASTGGNVLIDGDKLVGIIDKKFGAITGIKGRGGVV